MDELYRKFLNRQCSPDEAGQLLAYLKTHEGTAAVEQLIAAELHDPVIGTVAPLEDEAAMEQVKNRLQQAILSQSVPRNHKKATLFMRYAAAAAIMILSTVGYYFVSSDNNRNTTEKNSIDIPPGTNKAILTLADGTAIDLSSGHDGIIVEGNTVTYSDGTGVSDLSDEIRDMSLSTPNGGTYQVILPDGTRVQLNAASTLKYPSRFSSDRREVELTGEAYFSVHGEQRPIPFIVKSAGQQILVLGTEFNVSAYPDETAVKTTLVNGSVRITALPDNTTDQSSATNHHSLILKPGEQSILSTAGIQTRIIDLHHEIAWTRGVFRFHETSLREVMQQLSRWYGVEVRIKDDIRTKKIYGKLFRSYSLLQATGILEGLEQGNIKFNLQQREGHSPLLTVSSASQKTEK